MIDIDAVLAERGKCHGVFATHAQISQNLKAVMRATPGWDRLDADQQEALEMNAHKVARILNGDPHHPDHWVDIGGYAKLVANRLEERLKNGK